MIRTRYSAERLLDAPATVVYHCLADYREHHRPEGFLPPQFSDLTVVRGGAGAGTDAAVFFATGGGVADVAGLAADGCALSKGARANVMTMAAVDSRRGDLMR